MCFLLTLSTLSFRLSESGVSAQSIGFFALVTLPYSLKFLWAPWVDSITFPWIKKDVSPEKAWGTFSLIGVIIAMIGLGLNSPEKVLMGTFVWATLLSLCAATYDIILDRLRIRLVATTHVGFGAAIESSGFRVGMIASGAGTLYLATYVGWSWAYICMVSFSFLSLITLLSLDIPKTPPSFMAIRAKNIYALHRRSLYSLKQPFLITILFILFGFKVADATLNTMAAPFLYDLGFTKIEFANVTKVFGISLMILGGVSGGGFIRWLSLRKSVSLTFLLQAVSCVLFYAQSCWGYNMVGLMWVVGLESFTSGLTGTVFIAYVSSWCRPPFQASHFTLLYSIGSLSRVLCSALSGWVADAW